MGLTTFESQKYICVKEGQQVAIVDTANGFNVDRRDMKAEGILMHRERHVIAVRAPQGETQTIIQVLDLTASAKLVTTTLNEKTVFWRWISNDKLAIVGTTSVYHLDITQGVNA
jgi:arginine repressor